MRKQPISLAEAIEVFGFRHPGCKVTKDLIGKTFRKLCFSVHTDKNKTISKKESGELIGKFTEAKKVLLENFTAIPKTKEGDTSAVSTVFVDYLKTVDAKNRKNPFTIYKKGRGYNG